ncbi:MAG: aspartate/glutamate racemase family protein [Moorea sp. SIO2I5]|nr:aspartate/glutamate racemase family protein [Moorena sp. SIO2I5]
MPTNCLSARLNPQHQYCFETAQQAITALPAYRRRLADIAKVHNSLGEVITDQDYPTEVMVLRPRHTKAPPLLLIGGMGPIPGVAGFEQACYMFQNTREIVLLQACAVPNRTTVMAEKRQAGSKTSRKTLAEEELVAMLEMAIRVGVAQCYTRHTPYPVIVLCNAAHYFLPQAWQRLLLNHPQMAIKLQWISLIESVVKHLTNGHWRRPLLLCTSATRWGQVYAHPLQANGIDLIEPSDPLQSTLMDCIYQGVKASNRDLTCELGEHFFVELLKTQPDPDCIIAGCSEIPCLLEWLQGTSTGAVGQFLSALQVINPVQLALNHAAQTVQPMAAMELSL